MGRTGIERRAEKMAFLRRAVASGGRFPSSRELEAAVGGNLLGANPRPRGASTRRSFRSLPILGVIAAGFADAAEPADLDSIPVDLAALDIRSADRAFALRVRGDSMTGAHIADGDLVVIEACEPKVGDIVAALIDGGTTLKRFVAKDGQLFLRAENPRYPDFIPLHELTIQGVLRAVVRVGDSSRRRISGD